ncbi:hypothetical protein H2248_011693 [Termitomyces sp. 'cryptogamus']|nr:hypothetical protein H2248_011693 [Termitomyces sp. 'cryptogamus']
MNFQPQFHAIEQRGFDLYREHITNYRSTLSLLKLTANQLFTEGRHTIENSLVVDPIKEEHNIREVTIVASIKDYIGSNSSVHTQWSAKVVENLTSSDLVNLLGRWGLDQFFNNESGFGCRTFVQGVIHALETNGYLEPGAEQSFVAETKFIAETTDHLVPDESGAGWAEYAF